MVSSKTSAKVEVRRLVERAQRGLSIEDEDGNVTLVSSGEVRADLMRAYRAGESSPEAEAGARLEAEYHADVARIRQIAEAWFDANKK